MSYQPDHQPDNRKANPFRPLLPMTPPPPPDEPDDPDAKLKAKLNTELNATVKAAADRDPAAEVKLAAILTDLLRDIAWRFGFLPATDRDDMLQEAKITIFRNLPSFNPEIASFKTWARTVAWRKMRDVLGKVRLPRRLYANVQKVRDAQDRFLHEEGCRPSIDELAEESGLSSKEVDEALNASAFTHAESIEEMTAAGRDIVAPEESHSTHDPEELMRCLGKLTAEDREIIALVYWKDLSHKEIARQLGITEENSRAKLKRAMDRLRKLMGTS